MRQRWPLDQKEKRTMARGRAPTQRKDRTQHNETPKKENTVYIWSCDSHKPRTKKNQQTKTRKTKNASFLLSLLLLVVSFCLLFPSLSGQKTLPGPAARPTPPKKGGQPPFLPFGCSLSARPRVFRLLFFSLPLFGNWYVRYFVCIDRCRFRCQKWLFFCPPGPALPRNGGTPRFLFKNTPLIPHCNFCKPVQTPFPPLSLLLFQGRLTAPSLQLHCLLIHTLLLLLNTKTHIHGPEKKK